MNNQNQYIASHIVSVLGQLGCKDACISPGARNAPLIFALEEDRNINTHSVLDERSSGFFALGIAKKTENPVILNCTSGTALGNFFPAIIEARMSEIPIIILTADRPKKIIKKGENQTIFQDKFYGKYVLKSLSIEYSENHFAGILEDINKIYNIAMGIREGDVMNERGPVHINVHLEDPLSFSSEKSSKERFDLSSINPIYKKSEKKEIGKFKKPVIICGQTNLHNHQEDIFRLAEALGAPIISDISSNITNHENVISFYDHFIDNINPDMIFRFGKKPISKKINQLINQNQSSTYLIRKRAVFNDDANNIISTVDQLLDNLSSSFCKDKNWLEIFKKNQIKIENSISENLEKDRINEYNFAFNLLEFIPEKSNIFIGNSLMIRSFDSYSKRPEKKLSFFSNRGASGIDGNISTALGIAKASNETSFLIIGDQSFMHDVSALQLLKDNQSNLVIFIINNFGGGIFDYLDISKTVDFKDTYEKFIRCSHTVNFKSIVSSYGIRYKRLNSISDLSLITEKGPMIYEILIDGD